MDARTSSRSLEAWRSKPELGRRRFPDAGRDDIPRIVASLVADGVDIYEVTLVRSTLEDAYLEAVEPE